MKKSNQLLKYKEMVGIAMSLAIFAVSCNPLEDGAATSFNSGKSESESMAGKTWQAIANLEVNPGNPAMSSGVSHYGFSLSASATDAVLAMSLYNSDVGRYVGYGRTFTKGSGWALPGSQFRLLSDDLTGDSPGHVGVGRNSAGTILAAYYGGASAQISVAQNSGIWGTSEATDLSVFPGSDLFARRDFDITEHQDYGYAIRTVFDAFGRAYIFMRHEPAPAEIRLFEWSEATGIAAASKFGNGTFDVGYAFDAVSDGLQRVCFTYEESAPSLYLTCLNGVTGNPYNIEGPTSISTGTNEVQGHSLASDGAGGVLAVFYQKVGGVWQVFGTKINNGVAGTPKRIDNGMPSGYESAPDGCDEQGCLSGRAFPRPAVAHVGGGTYVAAWAAVDIDEKLSALFGATYDPVSGWGPVLNVTEARRYLYRPSFHSPRLHGNNNGDAVLAVRFIAIEQSVSQPQLDIYKTIVGRYHKEVGFRKISKTGGGCSPSTSQLYAACTQPPALAVFDNGDAVVVYQDQDQNNRYRLKSIEFKQ